MHLLCLPQDPLNLFIILWNCIAYLHIFTLLFLNKQQPAPTNRHGLHIFTNLKNQSSRGFRAAASASFWASASARSLPRVVK